MQFHAADRGEQERQQQHKGIPRGRIEEKDADYQPDEDGAHPQPCFEHGAGPG